MGGGFLTVYVLLWITAVALSFFSVILADICIEPDDAILNITSMEATSNEFYFKCDEATYTKPNPQLSAFVSLDVAYNDIYENANNIVCALSWGAPHALCTNANGGLSGKCDAGSCGAST